MTLICNLGIIPPPNLIVKDAGIKNFRFHDLRHTFGTRAADSGAPLTAILDTLGHASIETTNRYAHATE
ncbi:MAG TPA: tyrosine-type recombinase/integrase, partial [Blastocatellia bacterium]|nr:tyrosine-type recombinase/integrase [Blastocatellia bacterium]